MSMSQPIFTYEKRSKALWGNGIYNLQDGRNILVIVNIYEAIAISLLLYYHQDTEVESQGMEIGVSGQTLTHKNIKVSMGHQYPNSTRSVKTNVVFIHIYWARAILMVCCDQEHTESKSQ